jgi:carbon storage regulator CsrA
MLVFSRQRDQSVMIGDDLRVTLFSIRSNRAYLAWYRRSSDRDFALLGRQALTVNEALAIAPDISVKLLDLRNETARLGFSIPRNLSLHRQEVWDAIRPRA